MADLYTSFATSVALRDAGAPQGDYADAECYYCSACGMAYPGTPENGWRRLDNDAWCGCGVHRTHARAWRLDEIIEAIRADGEHTVDIEDHGEWVVRAWHNGFCISPRVHASLVEALAAAWLAVLKEVKRG